MPSTIGVDVGGTYIKAGIIDNRGKITQKTKTLTNAKAGRDEVIENIIKVVEKLFSKQTKAIGIGVAGVTDRIDGVVIDTPNLPLHDVPLAGIIKSKFKKKIRLDNDANCFAIAEAKFGNGKKFRNVLCLTLGTGIGSALIIKGKLYQGSGNALELGHTTLHYKGPKCKCGNQGCVEEFISTRGLLKIAKRYGLNVKDPLDVFLAAERNNRKAKKTFEAYGEILGVALANFVNTFDPDIIVLGGQITGAWRFFNKTMVREMNKRSFIPACKVVRTEVKSAGIVGAASLVWVFAIQPQPKPLLSNKSPTYL